jgi:RND family efflux transporter MFP subunit
VPAVKAEAVAPAAPPGARALSGVLLVAEETRLSFAVGGKLLAVPLREGESFRSGQLLARLDPADFEREVATQRARRAAAASRLREAEENLRRKQSLAATGAVAKVDLARAETTVVTARADLEVAAAALATATANLGRTRLVAPRDGIVIRLVAKQFEEVAPGQPVYEVGTRDALEVVFLVPETLVPGLGYDDPVQVVVPGLGGREAEARVAEISASAEAGNAFQVRARLLTTPAGARSGMTANVTLPAAAGAADARPSFGVPLAALVLDSTATGPVVGREAGVFVLDAAAGVVRRRTVEILGITGNRVLVSAGLAPGEEVVTAGVAFLRDGQPVRRWQPPE